MKTNEYLMSYEDLVAVEVPKQTSTYKPVSHLQLIDVTMDSLYHAGFQLDKAEYSSARNGNVANAKFAISNIADSEMQLQIGWQNSYDKSLSLKFAIGTKIFICSNGCVSGDYGSFKKKHTGQVQIFTPENISGFINGAAITFEQIQKERDFMKIVELSKKEQAEILGRMFIEEEIITSTQLNIIKRELDTPTYDYGAKNSMWELYQFTTFSMKEAHPSDWLNGHIDAHNFFVKNSTLVLPQSPPIILEMS